MNRKGMMGFPVRLAITFMILSVAVPPMAHLAGDMMDESDISEASSEAERISDVLSRTYYSGTGSRNTVDVSIDGGCSIRIGGTGSDAYTLTVMKDDEEKNKLFLERPSVRIVGDALNVSGNRTLMCESLGNGVEVTVID